MMPTVLPYSPAITLDALDQCMDGLRFRCDASAPRVIQELGRGCRLLTGYHPQEIQALAGLNALVHPEDLAVLEATLQTACEMNTSYRLEYRLRMADGSEKWILERGKPNLDTHPPCIDGHLEDISARVEALFKLAAIETRYRSLFENSVLGVFQSTEDGHYLDVNQALADIYRFPNPQALINSLADIEHNLYVNPRRRNEFKRLIENNGQVIDFESEVYCADGQRIWISENARAVRAPDGSLMYYEGMVRDITERRQHQSTLQFQATHDPLTGLPNRNLLHDRLEQAAAQAKRAKASVALAFVDLDNFKVINDSLGHSAGDELLMNVAHRLRHALREVDSVIRYGGDEFVLLMTNQTSREDTETQLERLLTAIQTPIKLGDHELHINCSIGVAYYPTDAQDLPTLLRVADMAMYDAKGNGKGKFHFYTRSLNQQAQERFALESALRYAIDAGQLSLVYQPKLDSERQLCGFEALVRWHSPEYGLITPNRFIPIAEETGLILPLGWQVLRHACNEAARWPTVKGREISVAVNLSARQLGEPCLLDEIQQALADSGLPARRLELEITESMLMGDIESTIAVLHDIRALGVRIAVDDFGTGYSSLSYLQRLPIDILKIDRSFVNGCEEGGEAMTIPHAIIFLGKSLKLHLVAEGVEKEEQMAILSLCGCNEFQGYLFARPLPPNELQPYFN